MKAIPWLSSIPPYENHLPELPQKLNFSPDSSAEEVVITGLPTRGTNNLSRPKIKITTSTTQKPWQLPVAEPLTGGSSNEVYNDGITLVFFKLRNV